MVANHSSLMISALQHYSYCPRQFALIHVEQAWAENRFTAEGKLLHKSVDNPSITKRRNIKYERGVLIRSKQFGIQGKMDLLEIEQSTPLKYFPVEFKRGKPKKEDWDRLQLCAQALCIEEMRTTTVQEGAIWYWEVRKRETVIIDEALRQETINTISQAHELLSAGKTPLPIKEYKKCHECSLKEICQPMVFALDRTEQYIQTIE